MNNNNEEFINLVHELNLHQDKIRSIFHDAEILISQSELICYLSGTKSEDFQRMPDTRLKAFKDGLNISGVKYQ
ncbi:MAG: DUF1456 family protein [Pseudomonadales bacterium]|nr:DUF1456 family protein [Pseudomonadales bacterium]